MFSGYIKLVLKPYTLECLVNFAQKAKVEVIHHLFKKNNMHYVSAKEEHAVKELLAHLTGFYLLGVGGVKPLSQTFQLQSQMIVAVVC